jgi:D-alanyl-D-alanine carboxypeptidase
VHPPQLPEHILARALARTAGPALSVAAVKEGALLYARGFGSDRLNDRRAATARTLYDIASLTKQFTATCILLLVREERVRLDAPVATFLPGLPHADRITLRHLLTHTSGYVDYYPLGYPDGDKLRDATPDEIVHRYARYPLQFEPGSAWSYSNTGYHILGQIVEIVSGRAFADFLSEEVLRRAGMASAFLNDPPRVTDAHALGYTRLCLGPIRAAERERAGWMYSSGGLAASADDLAAWYIALLDHRILNEAELSTMMMPFRLNDGTMAPAAMGWFVEQHGKRTLVLHSGGLAGFATQAIAIPAERIAVIVLGNGDHLQVGLIARALLEEIAGAPFPPAPPLEPDDAALQSLVEWMRRMQSGEIAREQMTPSLQRWLNAERTSDAERGLRRLGPIGDATLQGAGERGGMAWSKARVRCTDGEADVLVRTTREGTLAELNAYPIP